ncbi:hypothetical protein [Paenibacillus sp. V4I3]|uniref:hypothetical protein n=1 Tax=Paenibacillus sp. V4I3 TaxID=3042305 RepID=UPI0027D7C729|nr:hypothetical protein [Paenibacillus sp. V4I3]
MILSQWKVDTIIISLTAPDADDRFVCKKVELWSKGLTDFDDDDHWLGAGDMERFEGQLYPLGLHLADDNYAVLDENLAVEAFKLYLKFDLPHKGLLKLRKLEDGYSVVYY